MPTITVKLPGVPRSKQRVRFTRRGHVYTPESTRSFEHMLRVEAAEQMNGRPPFEGPIALDVSVKIVPPRSWSGRKHQRAITGEIQPTVRPDLDNIMKSTDALNKLVWFDDAQITSATLRKAYAETTEIVITVTATDGN